MFMAVAGQGEVIEMNDDQPWDGDLVFEVFDMELHEVEINWSNYETTFVEDGEVLCVGEWFVDTPVEDWNW
jgi:hypothetical protein